ncbi:LysR substrate-binding domain-containing protein [Novosphingobium sp. NDB2Meth1]|uniref:LysR substrate-binding domain-containing protein n=1 Tax=Novosphingobium sp. NDB2Meth1 TaxID=1892847 RepID=UPI0009306186|nr:LysR substrate-binding domain-containing protein [Novosphingobium sp. NDB2Meth1]
MDRFDALRTLVAAVDGGSLSAASRTLRMPLSTVSRKISELEEHLTTQLLVRTPRKLLLTDAGEAFVHTARRLLIELDEAERAASGEYREPLGELLVTAPIAFGKLHILPVVLEFLRAYPKVDVRLVLADTVVDLIDNHVDVAARLGRLPDSGLVGMRVGEVRWITVASPRYLAERGLPETPAALEAHDCLAFEGLQASRTWNFSGEAEGTPLQIRPRLGVNTADALVEAASEGLGIARMTSYQAAPALRDGRLVEILKPYVGRSIPVHLVHTGPALLPLKLRAFLDFAAPRLRASLAALPR